MLLTLQTKKSLGVVGNIYATWNPLDKDADITLSNGNLTAVNVTSASNKAVRATIGKSTGKWVFEIGIALNDNNPMVGIGDGAFALTNFLGTFANSFGLHTGGANHNGIVDQYGPSQAMTTAMVMYAVDLDAGKAWVSAGGSIWYGGNNPSTGLTPYLLFTPNMTIYPAASSINTTNNPITLNAGQSAFSNTVPSGFNAGWYN